MLGQEFVRDELNKFAKYVIQQARNNLSKGKFNDSKNLYDSLDFNIDSKKEIVSLLFEMADYGQFKDRGVKGANPNKLSPNTKIRGQQAPNSPFRFGSKSSAGTFKDFAKRMSLFAKSKNIRFREFKTINGRKVSTGRFAKGGFDAIGYVIARNIYNRGIRPSMFFTRPFISAFKRLPDELVKAYSIGIEKQIKVNITKQ